MSSWSEHDLRAIAESHDLSPRFGRTASPMAPQPWCGPWSSMATSTCGRPTASNPAGHSRHDGPTSATVKISPR